MRALFLTLVALAFNCGFCQTHQILIDFGSNPSPTPWNNITGARTGVANGLMNSFGQTTSINLIVADSFNGVNTSGTQNPATALGLTPEASGDSFYGNTVLFSGMTQPTGGVEWSNLDVTKEYTFHVFASRLATDNRETRYVISGATQDTGYINVANNTDSIVSFSLYPSNSGTIQITASPGPNNTNTYGFFYLGAVIIEYTDVLPTPELELLSPNGGEFWQVGKSVDIKWKSTTLSQTILEYSTDNGNNWNTIDTISSAVNVYNWTVPNSPSTQCLVRILSDTLMDESLANFEISSSTDECRIVVIGSSTAAGTGASLPDSAWVNRYRNEIYQNDTRYPVTNIARGGYTTYHLLPSGNPRSDSVGITIDTARNITKAISYNPAAIIINLPSNDAANLFSVEDQMTNFRLMYSEAQQQNIPVWVCTTQPRNFSNSAQVTLQMVARDSISAYFGNYTLDFWNGIADANGFILTNLNSGDGVHLNDEGHKLLFQKVIDKGITDSLCIDTTVSVGLLNETLIHHNEISIYPNPSEGLFQVDIHSSDSSEKNLVIYDGMGRTILTSSLIQNTFQIDLRRYKKGIYFYKIERDGEAFSGSLLKN